MALVPDPPRVGFEEDIANIVQVDGLQRLLQRIHASVNALGDQLEMARAEASRRADGIDRRVDALEVLLGEKAGQRDIRRLEGDARQARDDASGRMTELAAKLTASSETAESRALKLEHRLHELEARALELASARDLRRLEGALDDRLTVEAFQTARQDIDSAMRAVGKDLSDAVRRVEAGVSQADAMLADHQSRLPLFAPMADLDKVQRELQSLAAKQEGGLHTMASELRQQLIAAERRVERRADETVGEVDALATGMRQLESELKTKISRDEALAQFAEAGRSGAAERRAAEQRTREAEASLLRKLEAQAGEATELAKRLADAERQAQGAAPRTVLAAVEERMLSFASRDEVSAAVEAHSAEALARTRSLGDHVSMHDQDLVRLAEAVDKAITAPARELEKVWRALDGLSRAAVRDVSPGRASRPSEPPSSYAGTGAAAPPSVDGELLTMSSAHTHVRDEAPVRSVAEAPPERMVNGVQLAASSLRTDLLRRKEALEERRRSIAAARLRAEAL